MLQELNLAWLIHRAVNRPEATRLEQILDWATAGGADILGLSNTRRLQMGKAADLVLNDLDSPIFSSVHTPLMAPLLCGEPVYVKDSFVNGRQVISDGQVAGLDTLEQTRKVQEGVARMVADV